MQRKFFVVHLKYNFLYNLCYTRRNKSWQKICFHLRHIDGAVKTQFS